MEKNSRAFNMAQEFYAQSSAGRRPLNESGNVGQNEPVVRAKVRFKRRKGIVCHPGFGMREHIQRAGFSGIGQSHKTDGRDEFQPPKF